MIFLSLRFYVKSILENLEVLKLLFFAIIEALNFDFNEFLHFPKADIHQMNKIQSPWNGKNGSFWTFTFFEIDFT